MGMRVETEMEMRDENEEKGREDHFLFSRSGLSVPWRQPGEHDACLLVFHPC